MTEKAHATGMDVYKERENEAQDRTGALLRLLLLLVREDHDVVIVLVLRGGRGGPVIPANRKW